MGDAGSPTPLVVTSRKGEIELVRHSSRESIRELNVLVTGYGPFKTVETNPSSQISQNLPTSLDPTTYRDVLLKHLSSSGRLPIRQPNTQPYIIRLHTYPTPLRVAYGPIAALVPSLIAWKHDETPEKATNLDIDLSRQSEAGAHINYDYVIHMGMAGGRKNYSLETQAHRDNYKIKDVDDRDGFISGEYNWKRENLPDMLKVGWDKEDVLARWREMIQQAELEHQQAASLRELDETQQNCSDLSGKSEKTDHAIVALSNDAGRYLCEFVLYTSLSTRWREAHEDTSGKEGDDIVPNQDAANPTLPISSGIGSHATTTTTGSSTELPQERVGKVAFLHVPGGVQEQDIARGRRVTETAILAIVSSWEDGYRNEEVYGEQTAA